MFLYNESLPDLVDKPPVVFQHGCVYDVYGEFSSLDEIIMNHGEWTEFSDPNEDSDEEMDWLIQPELDVEEINLRKSIRKNDDPSHYLEIQMELDAMENPLWMTFDESD